MLLMYITFLIALYCIVFLFFFFFFFKQKTAYEMRISDWSSDVCSSDLHGEQDAIFTGTFGIVRHRGGDAGDWRSGGSGGALGKDLFAAAAGKTDRKSTRLNSSH